MAFNETARTLQLRLSGEANFTNEELKAVVGLLAGLGVAWKLNFAASS